MGQASILSGGPDGRYVIELDFGEQYRLAVIATLQNLLAQIDANIAAEEARRAAAAADEAAAQAQLDQAIADQIAAVQTGGAIDNKALQFVRAFFLRAQAERTRLDSLLQALKFDRAATARRITTWQAFQPLSQRQAWCADYTEDGAGQVATLEINGEPGLIVIAPGARVPLQTDGVVRAREVMSGPQAYLNAALLPGWQRHSPTYRWGTIHDIDTDTDRCRVNLASATSSAQNLPINEASVLTNVLVQYMTCNAAAFEEGDRVVVEFQGRDWSQPRVIGFLDNPRPCQQFLASYFGVGLAVNDGAPILLAQQQKGKNENWDPYTAPAGNEVVKFLGWDDGVATRERNDGEATESITKTARYMVAASFTCSYRLFFIFTAWGEGYDPNGGSPIFRDFTLSLFESSSWQAGVSDSTVISPAPVQRLSARLTGTTLYELTQQEVLEYILQGNETYSQPTGPLFIQAGVAPNRTQTITYTRTGTSAVFTVTGDAAPTPPGVPTLFVGDQLVGAPQPGSLEDIDSPGPGNAISFIPTSWSAAY